MLTQIQSEYLQTVEAIHFLEKQHCFDEKWEALNELQWDLQPALIKWFSSKNMEVPKSVSKMIANFEGLNMVHQDALCLTIARWDSQS